MSTPSTVDTRTVAISGASGLVGSALVDSLHEHGDRTVSLVRRKPMSYDEEIPWSPDEGEINAQRLEGMDAVVHLAGENIAGSRWTDAVKRRIRDSRVNGTTLLSEAIAGLDRKPEVLVCASATGYYGDRGDELLDENSTPGEGFLPDVCQAWEAACRPARDAGIRVVNLRIGVVLAGAGGALQEMLFPFKMGVGGVIGSGQQYWSWVALADVVGAIRHAIETPSLDGPVNAVAPNACTNRAFTKTLGQVIHRPTIVPLPGFAARLVLGQMADDLLLASVRVEPRRLRETGYEFQYPDLDPALRQALDRPAG